VKAGPGIKDGLLLLVSGTFTAVGLLLLIAGRGGRGPIAVSTFFGMCTCIAVWSIVEKRRMAESLEVTRVEIVGSVPIPARQGIRWAMGIGLTVGGGVMAWSGGPIGAGFQAISLFLVAVGVVLMGLLATGRAGGQTLTFEPEGLRFGNRRGSFLVRWTNFARVEVIEFQSNPALVASVHDVGELVASAGGAGTPEGRKVARAVVQNRTWVGWDLFLLPYHFGIDAVLLAKAVASYVEDPSRRAELAPRRALSGGAADRP